MELLQIHIEEQEKKGDSVDAELMDRNSLRDRIQAVVDKAVKKMKNLETELTKLSADNKLKVNEDKQCLAAKAAVKHEVETKQNEYKEAQETYKREREMWEAKLKNLTTQMEQRSKICDYVKMGSDVVKFCGPNKRREDVKSQTNLTPSNLIQ